MAKNHTFGGVSGPKLAFLGFPRVWGHILAGVVGKIPPGGGKKGSIFDPKWGPKPVPGGFFRILGGS